MALGKMVTQALEKRHSLIQLQWRTGILSLALLINGCQSTPKSEPAVIAPMPAPILNGASYQKQREVNARPMSKMAASASMQMAMPTGVMIRNVPMPSESRENYQKTPENEFTASQVNSVSTFSLDTDTGSYANVRRFVEQGQRPPADAVRIEELMNYFSYEPGKKVEKHPFAVSTEMMPAPWQPNHWLLKVSLKATNDNATVKQRPASNLVFLVDVSGSMNAPDKLPLAQATLRLLTKQLGANDYISLITYAGNTQVVLPATSGKEQDKILKAIDSLNAGGSTNGEAALKLAYKEADKHFIPKGVNRILMLTDGDFNVGVASTEEMKEIVSKAREKGVSLSTFGFGEGNYNDAMMEQMADAGNGNYSYIDTLSEANKVLNEEMNATLVTVAKDVKVQMEFNPTVVQQWRLVGYENRVLKEEDFKNDKVDAGDTGDGKSIVVLYELVPHQSDKYKERLYQQPTVTPIKGEELGQIRVRYKRPDGKNSTQFDWIVPTKLTDKPSNDLKFAAAVAGYGQLLKDSTHKGTWSYKQSAELAGQGLGEDKGGYRAQFVKLVTMTDAIVPNK